MKVFRQPQPDTWQAILARPTMDATTLLGIVSPIVEEVKQAGDSALRAFAEKFDRVQLGDLLVSPAEFEEAAQLVSPALQDAIRLAHGNIHRFHEAQKFKPIQVETQPGVKCWQEAKPIARVGLYIPGGSAPLFSTVLMLATPAQIAGCEEIVLCTPPDAAGKVHPAILFAAQTAGVTRVVKAGGAQAIAAMTHGTESVPRVDKIFGPGNQYVTAAKLLASIAGVAIDMPAGPSEVMVVADEHSRADFVAADLLSQAEHGADSQVVLISTSESNTEAVLEQVELQLQKLPRAETARKALENSVAIVVRTQEEVVDLINTYAPEHLILATQDYATLAKAVKHAGSVFLGAWSCESAGDYASGTNHTLPTGGAARAWSGLSLDSFCKKITYQELTPEGIKAIGTAVEQMAGAEQLEAHKVAMTLRLQAVHQA